MTDRPIVTPEPASSILLVRDGDSGLEVLMMERAHTMAFAPGAFVFPGGKVDKRDGDVAFWASHTDGELPADLGFRTAAIRELLEEVGVMLADHADEPVPVAVAARIRDDISKDMSVFYEEVDAAGLTLHVNDLVPFAHWVTPEGMPKRYDTRFYVAAMPEGQEAVEDGNEALSVRWVSPQTLLSEWEAETTPLMFPTRLNLIKLARANSVVDAMAQARDTEPYITIPSVLRSDEGVSVTISEEAGYGVTQATLRELRVERGSKKQG